MHPNSSPLAEAERQLELQRQLIVALTPELYRQLALYLQVLRKGLLHAVQQACFHLATQTYPERFSAIGASRRLELQERLQALVQRCNCLLTVEQLMGLASQLQSRQQRQRRRDQQRLLLALAADHGNDDDPGEVDGEDHPRDGGLGPGDSGDSPFGQHRGSVHLGLDLPLSADLFGSGLEGLGSWLAGFATQGDSLQDDLGPHEAGEELQREETPQDDSPQEDSPQEDSSQDDSDHEEGNYPDEVQPEEAGHQGMLSPLADAEPDGPQPPDPGLALASLDPGAEPGRGAERERDQTSDPADPFGPAGDLGDQPGLGAGDHHPASSPNELDPLDPAPLDPAPLQGDGPDPDPDEGLPRQGDRSAPPHQGPASPAAPRPSARSGAGQPPGPQGASDGPRRPRRPVLRRGPGPNGRQRSAAPGGSSDEFQFFQSLFALAAEGLGRETSGLANPGSAASGLGESGPAESGQTQSGQTQSGQGESLQGAGDASPDGPAEHSASLEGGEHGELAIRLELLRQAGGPGQAPDAAGWQAQDSLMPQDAPRLLAWWEALDGALQRRLRNLSNAVNGELLRLGITRSHLPMPLLDAVLQGQLDPLPAPANLVRLQMPFGGDSPASPGGAGPGAFPLGGPLDLVALLLRPTDLEFETPSLRVCRQRLEQNRARLRTMAQRHRYWQRRVQALEAERQWFQDSPPTSR